MFRLEKTIHFEASHQLPNHDGKCRRLHGHSWIAILIVEGEHLIKSGPKKDMLVDFADLSKICENLLTNYLDHYHLNDTTGLENPTSEAIAEWIYARLAPIVRRLRNPLCGTTTETEIHLLSVRVEETCTSACTYSPPSPSQRESTGTSKHRTKVKF